MITSHCLTWVSVGCSDPGIWCFLCCNERCWDALLFPPSLAAHWPHYHRHNQLWAPAPAPQSSQAGEEIPQAVTRPDQVWGITGALVARATSPVSSVMTIMTCDESRDVSSLLLWSNMKHTLPWQPLTYTPRLCIDKSAGRGGPGQKLLWTLNILYTEHWARRPGGIKSLSKSLANSCNQLKQVQGNKNRANWHLEAIFIYSPLVGCCLEDCICLELNVSVQERFK